MTQSTLGYTGLQLLIHYILKFTTLGVSSVNLIIILQYHTHTCIARKKKKQKPSFKLKLKQIIQNSVIEKKNFLFWIKSFPECLVVLLKCLDFFKESKQLVIWGFLIIKRRAQQSVNILLCKVQETLPLPLWELSSCKMAICALVIFLFTKKFNL